MYEIVRQRGLKGIRQLSRQFKDISARLQNPGRFPRSPTVFMYHSVSERSTREWGPWHYGVTPDEFGDHMARLDDTTTVVSLDALVDWLMGRGTIPSNAVVLTFDDGYLDFVRKAVPILEQYEFPATVYVPTVAFDKEPWVPFEQCLATALLDVENIDITLDNFSISHSVATHSDLIDCYEQIREVAKFSTPSFRERILDALNAEPPVADRVVTPDDLRELRNHPLVTIGAHGHAHVPFASLSANEQREQVQQSKSRLERILGQPPRHFSFPYGSFDRSALRAVKDGGFESAVTTHSRRVSPRDWYRPYKIPRIDAANKLTEILS